MSNIEITVDGIRLESSSCLLSRRAHLTIQGPPNQFGPRGPIIKLAFPPIDRLRFLSTEVLGSSLLEEIDRTDDKLILSTDQGIPRFRQIAFVAAVAAETKADGLIRLP